MRVGYVDTSCLVAIAFGEPGYEAVVARLDGIDQLYASNLLEAELRAALRRESVRHDDALTAALSWVLPDRPLSTEIATVLEAGHVRGADAWHLACALYLSPDPAELEFLTVDKRQATVAAAIGFLLDADSLGQSG
jgi:predicted nucleic acid-binding protein